MELFKTYRYKGVSVDEHQWMQAIRKGNKKYLQDIAEKYYDDIFRFCAFFTGNREDAYDLAQETFLRFIRYAEGYRDRNLKGYLLTIAANVCRNHMMRKAKENAFLVFAEGLGQGGDGWEWLAGEKKWRNRELLDGEKPERSRERSREEEAERNRERLDGTWENRPQVQGLPEQSALAADVHDRLMQALAWLPDMQREAILLYYLHDLKYREIGKMTGVSVSTVKSRVRQGMEKLQGSLKREDFI